MVVFLLFSLCCICLADMAVPVSPPATDPTDHRLSRQQCSRTCFIYGTHIITCGNDVTAEDLHICYGAIADGTPAVVDLTHCHLDKLDRLTFSDMPGIKDLYLDGASVDLVSSDAFLDLHELTFVSLREMDIPIKAIAQSLLEAPSLTKV